MVAKGRKAGLMKLKTVGHGLRAACCRFGFAACCGELFGGSGIFSTAETQREDEVTEESWVSF
jgi:hypothetical protein